MKKTIYCLLPQVAENSYLDLDNQRVITVTPANQKTIKVQLDKQSFRNNNCTNCELRVEEKELIKSMKAAGLMASTINKISYCNSHNLCTSSDQMLALCPAGHNLSSLQEITINVPKLVWIYNWNITGKEQFKVYAVKEEDDDFFTVVPYLLSNVYTKPLACISWPKNQARPANLRQAYNAYWDSPFSDESWVVDTSTTYLEHLTSYDPLLASDNFLNLDATNLFKFTSVDGIFYSEDDKIVNTIPKRINNLSTLVGTIRQGANNNWLININNFLFNKTGKLSGTAKLTLLG